MENETQKLFAENVNQKCWITLTTPEQEVDGTVRRVSTDWVELAHSGGLTTFVFYRHIQAVSFKHKP